MTVHAVRIKTAVKQQDNPSNVPSPGPPDWKPQLLEDRIGQNILDKFSEELSGIAKPVRKNDLNVDGSGVKHFLGVRRFNDTESKTSLLDEFENNIAADADWYVIEYHKCEDDNPSGNCPDWTEERVSGNPPSEVRI